MLQYAMLSSRQYYAVYYDLFWQLITIRMFMSTFNCCAFMCCNGQRVHTVNFVVHNVQCTVNGKLLATRTVQGTLLQDLDFIQLFIIIS